MGERPKFFDDLAGVAGGAMSALAGLREEAESTIRARVEEVIRKLDLVRREDLDAVQEIAANARSAQLALESRVTALEGELAALRSAPGAASQTQRSVPGTTPEPESPSGPAGTGAV